MVFVSTLNLFPLYFSELWGQERAKQITKNKTRDELLCVFYMSKRFCNMMS